MARISSDLMRFAVAGHCVDRMSKGEAKFGGVAPRAAKEKRGTARHSSGEAERRTAKNCIGPAEFCFGT